MRGSYGRSVCVEEASHEKKVEKSPLQLSREEFGRHGADKAFIDALKQSLKVCLDI